MFTKYLELKILSITYKAFFRHLYKKPQADTMFLKRKKNQIFYKPIKNPFGAANLSKMIIKAQNVNF